MAKDAVPTLVTSKICPFAHRAWLTLLEKEIAFNMHEVDLKAKSPFFKETYAKATGRTEGSDGKVPILIDGDRILAESTIVAEYLDTKVGDAATRLLPEDPWLRAKVRLFTEYFANTVVPAFYALHRAGTGDATALLEALRGVNRRLEEQWAEQGQRGPYFLGDRFSFAEVLTWPWIERLRDVRRVEVPSTDDFAAFTAWADAVSTRPSVQAAKQPAGFFANYVNNVISKQ